jgi:hypothetical protein
MTDGRHRWQRQRLRAVIHPRLCYSRHPPKNTPRMGFAEFGRGDRFGQLNHFLIGLVEVYAVDA